MVPPLVKVSTDRLLDLPGIGLGRKDEGGVEERDEKKGPSALGDGERSEEGDLA